jgi:tetratricopeptide (TPR) repeat protein
MSTDSLVGRRTELAALKGLVGDALTGRGGLALVTGMAGIGKTACLAAAMEHAAAQGCAVGWGTCWDGGGAPAFWPWIQAFRELGQAVASGERPALLGEHERGETMPTDRFELFDSSTSWLATISRTRPAVVVLDDLQWADIPSVVLLEFVAQRLARLPVAILAAYRDGDVHATHPLRAHLARLTATGRPLPLAGLSISEVVQVLAGLGAADRTEWTAARMCERTDGNPFFVRELARLPDPSAALPASIRELLRRQRDALPAEVRLMMEWAAVAGPEVRPELLSALSSTGLPETTAACAAAVEAGILSCVGTVLSFRHDLYRETVYADLDGTRRAGMHLATAEWLEEHPGASRSTTTDQVRHFVAAAPLAGDAGPLRAGRAAAAEAMAALAYEEAAHLCERVLEVVDPAPRRDPDRAELLVRAGEAWLKAGSGQRARHAFSAAAVAARRRGRPDLLGAAAVGVASVGSVSSAGDENIVALLDEALDALGAEASPIRAQVLAGLARELYHSQHDPLNRQDELSLTSVEVARSLGERDVLARCLLARYDIVWRPGTTAERLGLLAELEALAAAGHQPELLLDVHMGRLTAFLELGDLRAWDELDAYAALADRLRLARAQAFALSRRATRATVEGRFEEAQQLIEEAAVRLDAVGEPDGPTERLAQTWDLYRANGRLAELTDEVRTFGERLWRPLFRGRLALCLLDAGERAKAEMAVRTVMDGAPIGARRDYIWLLVLSNLADAATQLGLTDICDRLYAAMAPFSGTCVVTAAGVGWNGALDFYLGLLARSLGRADDGQRHLEAALATHERFGAVPWADRTRAMLAAAGRARLGRDGDGFSVVFAGRSVRVADTKGLRDLARLLASPGADVHVLDLVGAEAAGADATLDERAKTAYRARLDRLAADLTDAEVRGDAVAAERALGEREAIAHQLAAATGLGGRDRRLGDSSERARKTVGARIRDTLTRLDRVHPDLAAHLRASVTLGTTCRYDPDPPTAWSVEPIR